MRIAVDRTVKIPLVVFMNIKCLLMLTLLAATLQAASEADLTFTPNGNTEYSVSSCDPSASGILDIPDNYNGKPVTSIGSSAFQGCSSLTSISIPTNVASIGDYAFYACTSLSNITIPSSVTSMGAGVFYNCSGLTGITIPNSVNSIGEQAFYACSGLTSITIPGSLTSIGASAFRNCSGLTSITIPDSVTSIGSSAFYNCSNLASAEFDGFAPSIGSQVFENTQVSYTVVGVTTAASYGGDGATYADLAVVDYSKIATAQYLYTQSEYDAKLFIEEVQDLRAGSTMIEIENEQATLTMEIEESSDLVSWATGSVSTIQIPLDAQAGKKFFRFKMAD